MWYFLVLFSSVFIRVHCILWLVLHKISIYHKSAEVTWPIFYCLLENRKRSLSGTAHSKFSFCIFDQSLVPLTPCVSKKSSLLGLVTLAQFYLHLGSVTYENHEGIVQTSSDLDWRQTMRYYQRFYNSTIFPLDPQNLSLSWALDIHC